MNKSPSPALSGTLSHQGRGPSCLFKLTENFCGFVKNFYRVPGKTFLLGEYAVLQGGPALIACTAPYFTLTINDTVSDKILKKNCFHSNSPAGKFLNDHPEIFQDLELTWASPYPQGGFGGSTAEFLACYQLYHQLTHSTFSLQDLYQTYLTYAYQNTGIQPSGADLIAQTQKQIVYFQANTSPRACLKSFSLKQAPTTFNWPFKNFSLLLFKTPHKLPTHQHLETLKTLPDFSDLSLLTQKAYQALQQANVNDFINAINQYAIELAKLNLTAEPTIHLLEKLKNHPACLAIKGCGAQGADVIAAITHTSNENDFISTCQSNQLTLVATHRELAEI